MQSDGAAPTGGSDQRSGCVQGECSAEADDQRDEGTEPGAEGGNEFPEAGEQHNESSCLHL